MPLSTLDGIRRTLDTMQSYNLYATLVAGLMVFVTSCASPEEIAARRQQQEIDDHETCTGYGFRKNSDGFRNCLLQLNIAREQENNYRYNYGYGYYGHGPRIGSGIYYMHH